MRNVEESNKKPEWIETERGNFVRIDAIELICVEAFASKVQLKAYGISGGIEDYIDIRTYHRDSRYENYNDRPTEDGKRELYDAETAAANDMLKIMKIISRGTYDAVIWQEYLVMHEVEETE